MRFDEVELEAVPLGGTDQSVEDDVQQGSEASRFRRCLAILTDLSLFAALGVALYPLIPVSRSALAIAGLAGFIIMVSCYYFAGRWFLWGKTIGGAIFDIQVVRDDYSAMTLRAATLRWAGVCLSLLIGGAGFVLAILPSRKSLCDRMSDTHCVS